MLMPRRLAASLRVSMGGGDRGDMGVSCGGDVSGVTGDMGSSVCHPLVVAVIGALSARVGWVR